MKKVLLWMAALSVVFTSVLFAGPGANKIACTNNDTDTFYGTNGSAQVTCNPTGDFTTGQSTDTSPGYNSGSKDCGLLNVPQGLGGTSAGQSYACTGGAKQVTPVSGE